MRRYVIFISVLLIATAGIYIAVRSMVCSPPVGRMIRNQIQAQFNSILAGSLAVDSISMHSLSKMTAYGVRMYPPGDTVAAIFAKRLTAGISLISLLAHRVELRTVGVEGLEVRYRYRQRPGLAEIFVPRNPVGEGSSWSAAIRVLAIENAAFIYSDSAAGLAVAVRGIGLRGTLKNTVDFSAELRTAACSLSMNGRRYAVFDSLAVKMRFSKNGIEAADLCAGGPVIRRIEGTGGLAWHMPQRFHAHLRMSADAIDSMNAAGLVPPPLSLSAVSLDVSGEGTLAEPSFDFNVRCGQLAYGKVSLDTLAVEGRYAAGVMRAAAAAAYPSIRTVLDYRRETTAEAVYHVLSGRADTVAAGEALALLGVRDVAGTASCTYNIRMSTIGAAPEHADIAVMLRHARVKNGRGFDAHIRASMDGKNVRCDASFSSANRIAAVGTLDNGGIDASASAMLCDLSPLWPFIKGGAPGGCVSVAAAIDGSLKNPRVSCSLHSDSLSWHGVLARAISVEADMRKNNVYVRTSGMHVSGAVADALMILAGVKADSGWIDADITARGPIDSLRAECGVRVGGLRFPWGGADMLEARCVMDKNDIHLPRFTIVKDSSAVIGEAMLGISDGLRASGDIWLVRRGGMGGHKGGAVHFTAALAGDSLAGRISAEQLRLPLMKPWVNIPEAAYGVMGGAIHIGGTLRNPVLEAVARVDSIGMAVQRRGRLSAEASLRDSLIAARCTLRIDGIDAPLSMAAALPLSPSRGWRLDSGSTNPPVVTLRGDGVDVGALFGAYTGDVAAEGRADIDMSLVYRNHVWVPSGTLRASAARCAYRPLQTIVENIVIDCALKGERDMPARIATGPITTPYGSALASSWRLRIDSDRIVLDSASLVFDGGSVTAEATVPFIPIDSLFASRAFAASCHVRRFPLSMVGRIAEGVSIQRGFLNGDVSIAGGPAFPSMHGGLRADSVMVAFEELRPALGPFSAEADCKGDSIFISRVDGVWGGGSFSASGAVSIDAAGFGGIRLEARGRGLSAAFGDDVVSADSVSLTMVSADGRMKLGGTVTLGQTEFERMIFAGDRPPAEHAAADSLLDKIDLALSLRMNRNLNAALEFVRGVGRGAVSAEARLDGTVEVGGNARAPLVSIDLAVVEGKALYLDREFVILNGRIRQPLQTALDPSINFTAAAPVKNLGRAAPNNIDTVMLVIRGEASDPQIQLVCREYNEAEIVALLTFGRPVFAASAGGQELQNRAEVLATQQFFGLVSHRMDLEKRLGLEELSLEGRLMGGEGPTLTASRKLGSRIKVTYTGRVGDRQEQRAVVSWELLPFLFLDGEVGADGTRGVDVKVKVTR